MSLEKGKKTDIKRKRGKLQSFQQDQIVGLFL